MKKLALITILSCLFFTTILAQEHAKGLIFNDAQYALIKQKAPLSRSLYYSLPKSYSLKEFAPIPKSQGSYGTCTGWATAYCALTIANSRANNITDKTLITKSAFSPGFIYKQIKDETDYSCQVGASISAALEIMKTKGAAKYNDLSEVNCPEELSDALFKKAQKNKISDYATVFDGSETAKFIVSAVKKSLSEGNPVVIGMKAPPSFDQVTELWKPTEDSDDSFGGHAMCVIGYDDEKFDGAFEIQNSWGTSWGKGGYFWISYKNFPLWVKYAFELIDMAAPVSQNGYDLTGKVEITLSNELISDAKFTDNKYILNRPQKSGTLFRLNLSNTTPAYVYALGTDKTGTVNIIFPYSKKISAALTYNQNNVAIPDDEHFIQTDNTVGTDYIAVLYSKIPLQVNDLKINIEKQTGTFEQKIRKVIGDKFISNTDIIYDKETISFKAKTNGKSVVLLLIESEHIK